MQGDVSVINDLVRSESAFVEEVMSEVHKVIVGQQHMVERILIGLFTNGHVLLEGVPGLAKTLTVNTIAQTISARFQRLQFTPDLLPADLVGTMIYNQQTGEFSTKKGPIFANIVLADEINRAPAKVQSALLEAMQERQVTIGEATYKLDDPFLVLATQNPIEQEGTYPLPEAQVDRFMLKIHVGYPTKDEELRILEMMTGDGAREPREIITREKLRRARDIVNQVYLDERIKRYIIDLVFATREPKLVGKGELADYIEFGASPRATIFLAKAARAHAFLKRRGFVLPEDVKSIGLDVLRHRVIPTYEAEAEELSSEDIVKRLFELVEVP
ncbi:MAG: MoxR family ATPase [Deltaproteobacteria bacterium]|nr:MAG: MoxR family ATPase [Deltaproteobacteria bacterium]